MSDDCRHRTDHGHGCSAGRHAPRDCEGCRVYDPVPDRGLRLYVATQSVVAVAIITTIGLSALMLAPWLNRGP